MDTILSINPELNKKITLDVQGWETLAIQYSTEIHANVSYLCWKVENTDQIFKVMSSIVYEKHGINYTDHFKLTLKTFREDFLEWKSQGFPEDWMKRYSAMFKNLIKA